MYTTNKGTTFGNISREGRVWKNSLLLMGVSVVAFYDRGKGFISRKLPPSSTLFKR